MDLDEDSLREINESLLQGTRIEPYVPALVRRLASSENNEARPARRASRVPACRLTRSPPTPMR